MMRSRAEWLHLIRRFLRSIRNHGPSVRDEAEVRALLTSPEWWMWSEMPGRDRRHSLEVLRRFDRGGAAPRGVRAAVLLHDAGKNASGLGLWMRVVATLVGPRGGRFRTYHDHEAIGAHRARGLGVDEDVLSVLERRADTGVLARLDAADDL